MPKDNFVKWGFTLAGCLWILAGLLSLLNRRGLGDNIWRVIFGVAMGIFFILLGRQRARKASDQ
ncbi:MAG TPA: hypothetical protein VF525_07630 [Pyrinomonadaceae bacterium]|jgi:hypothetical protein